jgi:hypothetical protein
MIEKEHLLEKESQEESALGGSNEENMLKKEVH